jgi:hypothetical protein
VVVVVVSELVEVIRLVVVLVVSELVDIIVLFIIDDVLVVELVGLTKIFVRVVTSEKPCVVVGFD